MSFWTEDRVSRLKFLWAQGLTAAAITLDLGDGATRNAVLAKIWRLGLSRSDPGPASASRGNRPPVAAAAAPPSAAPPADGKATTLSVRLLQCRWPYGDPAQTGFSLCGCGVARGAYCAAHAAVAYKARPVSVESLMRLAGMAL